MAGNHDCSAGCELLISIGSPQSLCDKTHLLASQRVQEWKEYWRERARARRGDGKFSLQKKRKIVISCNHRGFTELNNKSE